VLAVFAVVPDRDSLPYAITQDVKAGILLAARRPKEASGRCGQTFSSGAFGCITQFSSGSAPAPIAIG
jgi:hypothetical protein